jgi:UDP-N-acetylmuramoyl-tripeptide--D-alanyl-D-alanine ligase
MLELGASAVALHEEVARSLVKAEIDHTLFCGKFADEFAAAALASGLPLNRISTFHDKAMLMPMLECVLSPRDVVCVKGSRSTHMEEVIQWLILRAGNAQRFAA